MGLQPATEFTILQSRVRLGDPHVWSDDRNHLSIRWAIYEPLVHYDKEGRYRPGLAGNWTLDDDAQTWTLKLRDSVTFHNGDIVAAQDVVASLERARDPEMAGELGTSGLYQTYLGGSKIEGLDERTVRIVLREPMADLLDLLTEIPIAARSNLDRLPDVHIGSGPCRLVEVSSDNVLMEAFSGYWAGRPPMDTVYWCGEPDEDRRIAALLAGRADLVTEVSPHSRRKIEPHEPVEVVEAGSCVCVIFMCNARSGVCSDKRVRQALNYALNVPEIIDTVKGGAGRPLNGPLTPVHLGYNPAVSPYPYDPGRAKGLLAEAGYVKGLRLTLDIPTSIPDEAPHLARIMSQQFARVGIAADINTVSNRQEYAEMVRNKKIHDGCCFDSSPLSTFRVLREKFHSGLAGPWWQGYSNSEVDELLDRAQSTPDRQGRQELYRRAYRIIHDDAPWLFLYSPTLLWATGPRAHGWKPGIDGVVRLS